MNGKIDDADGRAAKSWAHILILSEL
jgi:hypothetical protein